MRNCPVCGTEIPDTARFCRDCGHTISAPTAIDDATDMKNSPPADAQPMDIPTLPARSFANDNEKEQDRAGLPSGSTASEEQPGASNQYLNSEDNDEQPDSVVLPDTQTSDLARGSGNGMASAEDASMVQETSHMGEVSTLTLSEPSPKEDVSQDEESPVASSPASAALPAQTPGTPAVKRERSSAAKWLIIGIIALILIAGGMGSLLIFLLPYAPHAPGTGGTASAVTSPSSITTPAASVCPGSTPATCLATRTGSTRTTSNGTVDLTFSGAVVGQMTGSKVVTCGPDQSVAGGMQYHVSVFGTVNGQQYALTFGVYPYTHPDTYTNSVFSFFGPAGSNSSIAQWRSSPGPGVSVTINSDAKSGTLEIGYVSGSDNSTAHVSGSWKCA